MDKKVKTTDLLLILYFSASILFGADSDIKLNSIGFLPDRPKLASIAASCSDFSVISVPEGEEIYSGTVTGQNVYTADFSSVTEDGTYYLDVPGVGKSAEFDIGLDIYNFPFYTVVRGMYLWRCGTAVSGTHNGITYSHEACHLNDGYLDYVSSEHTIKDGTGGWHDAGDFGKYTVNAGITVGMMFQAWEHFQDKIEGISLDIPESGGSIPDYLAEMKWEIDWVLKMQYPDGSGKVSHKLTRTDFSDFIMPEDDYEDRYFVPWGSAATADFVAMLAMASRIFQPYDASYSQQCLDAATLSYDFLAANTANHSADQSGFSTGGYTTSDSDDRLWAAAEMWETTGDSKYLNDFESRVNGFIDKIDEDWDWGNVKNLGMFTYLLSERSGKNSSVYNSIHDALISVADDIVSTTDSDEYARPLGSAYYWGCNGTVARQTMNLQIANMISPNEDYVNTCLDAIGHLFGHNYYCRSYITGLGHNPPMNPHDRRSGSDGITDPWPGYLVGGRHSNKDWVDEEGSYETNEIAINWQGALIYALAGFIDNEATIQVKPRLIQKYSVSSNLTTPVCSRIVGSRFTIPKHLLGKADCFDLYDLRGALLGRVYAGDRKVVDLEKITLGSGVYLIRAVYDTTPLE